MAKPPPDIGDAAPKRAQPKTRHFRLRNRLREKAGGGVPGKPGKIPEELLELANAELAKMAEEYPNWVEESLAAMYAAYQEAAGKPSAERGSHFARLNVLAHEMKGQGGTFGYPLITTFGSSLHQFTAGDAPRTDAHLEIVKAIIDAMRAVIKDRIEGDGGEIGRQLKEALKRVIAKQLGAHASNTPAAGDT